MRFFVASFLVCVFFGVGSGFAGIEEFKAKQLCGSKHCLETEESMQEKQIAEGVVCVYNATQHKTLACNSCKKKKKGD